MLALSPKRLAYSAVLTGLLVLVAVGGMAVARGIAHSQTAADNDASVRLLIEAQVQMETAASLDFTEPFEPEDFKRIFAALEEAIKLQRSGELREAHAHVSRINERVVEMAKMAREHGNEGIYEIMVKTNNLLGEWLRLNTPTPQPVPSPVPQPVAQWKYSSKFVCGSERSRESGFTPDFGNHPEYFSEQNYQTEINIHNFSNQRVVFAVSAVNANPMGTPRGQVSGKIREVLGPNQAMQVNCRNIQAMFIPDVPHEVCQGKREAQKALRELLATDALNTDAIGSVDAFVEHNEVIVGLIEALQKAIRMEEGGELRQALELEREIVQKLNRLISVAEDRGLERVAKRLTEARDLVQRCIRILVSDIEKVTDANDVDALTLLPRVKDGFVVIETVHQLEVTAVYRATSHNKSISGGVGSGISIDVEQIQPHRVSNILPLPPIEPRPIDPPVVIPTPEPVDPTPTPNTVRLNRVRIDSDFFNAVGVGNAPSDEPNNDGGNGSNDKFFKASTDVSR